MGFRLWRGGLGAGVLRKTIHRLGVGWFGDGVSGVGGDLV